MPSISGDSGAMSHPRSGLTTDSEMPTLSGTWLMIDSVGTPCSLPPSG